MTIPATTAAAARSAIIKPPPAALFALTDFAPARADTAPAGAESDNFEAAGAADASVGTTISEAAIAADVRTLDMRI